jgi:2'-5' RNA ligase
MRLFYALWPDDEARTALSGLLQNVTGRRTRTENLHITLAFLGEQEESSLPALNALLNDLPASDIKLVINRLGYFSRQRIAWAGMEEVPEELHALHKTLAERLDALGVVYDRRTDFRPHITLARNAAPPNETSIEPITWHARHIGLVQSVMQPRGVNYQLIGSRIFNQGGGSTG